MSRSTFKCLTPFSIYHFTALKYPADGRVYRLESDALMSRRPSRASESPSPDRRKSRALDTMPELATNDFRRTGPSGIVLMILAGVLVGGGLGLLALPGILKPKSSAPADPPEAEKTSKPAGKTEAKSDSSADYDPNKLYPHTNRLRP